jgi:hypothetical protein
MTGPTNLWYVVRVLTLLTGGYQFGYSEKYQRWVITK